MVDEVVIQALIVAEDRSAKTFEDAKKRVDDLTKTQQDAATKIEAASVKLASGQTKVNMKAAEFLAIQKQLDNATKSLTQAHKDQEKALDNLNKSHDKLARAQSQFAREHKTVWQSASADIAGYATSFIGVAAAMEVIRRSVTTWAEFERGLNRISIESQTVGHDLEEVGEAIEELARTTGKNTEQLTDGFRKYRDMLGGGAKEAMESYNAISRAAFAAGVNQNTMIEAAIGAIKQLGVPQNQVKDMLDIWVQSIPSSMMQTWTTASTQIIGKMRDIGYSATDGGKKVAAEFGSVATALGSADRATDLFNKTLQTTTDTGTMIGLTLIPQVEAIMKGSGENKNIEAMKLLVNLWQQLGVYSSDWTTKDIARKEFTKGWTDDQLRAAKETVDQEEKITAEAIKNGEARETVAKRYKVLQNDTQFQVDKLNASFKELYAEIGKAFGTSIIKAFIDIVKTTKEELEGIRKVIRAIFPEDRAKTTLQRMQEHQQAPPLYGPGSTPTPPPLKPFIKGIGTRRAPAQPGGGMEEGGEFKVAGTGGVDREPVGFMATAGERVAVSTPLQDSLQAQQDKADIAAREHFGRFHQTAFTKTTGAPWWPGSGVREPGAEGGKGAGGGMGGLPGMGPGGTTQYPSNTGSTGSTGTTDPPGTGTTPLKTPVGTDVTSATGPAEDLKTAVERGYLSQPAAGGAGVAGGIDRSSLSNQLTPAMIAQLAGLTAAEVGGSDVEKRKTFLATVLNRTMIQTGNISKQLNNGYYPGTQNNRVDAESIERFKKTVLDPVMKGEGGDYTHNASNAIGNPVADNAARRHGPGAGKWIGNDKNKEFFYRKVAEGELAKIAKLPRLKGADPNAPAQDDPNAKSAVTAGTASSIQAAVRSGQTLDSSGNVTDTASTGNVDHDANLAYLRARGGHDMRTDPNDKGQLHPVMAQRLVTAAQAYEKETGKRANIGQMYRDQATQAKYYQEYKSGGGGLAAAPGPNAPHQGRATDIPRGEFLTWMHKNAQKYNLEFLTGDAFRKDPVHVQISAAEWQKIRDQKIPAAPTTKVAGPATAPGVKSDVEKRAEEVYKKAQERHNKPAVAPTNTKVETSSPADGRKSEEKAAGKRLGGDGGGPTPAPIRRIPSPPGQEQRAAGKGGGPAAVVTAHPVSPQADPIPGRADGGDVTAGQPYIVGEQGPETFVPGQSGAVRPDEWEVRKQRALGPPGGGFSEWSNINYDAVLSQQRELHAEMSKPIRPQMELPRAGPIRQRMSRHVEAQRERDVGQMSRHAAHSDIGFV